MSAAPSAADRDRPIARYNTVAIVLHWLVAAMMLFAVCAGLAAANTKGEAGHELMNTHKSIGLTIFGFVVLRVLWRLAHKPPPFPAAYPYRERIAAHVVHYGLYALMLLLPITGYIHDSAWKKAASYPLIYFGFTEFPRLAVVQHLDLAMRERVHDLFGATHVYLGYGLYLLFALHLLGVAKHHAFDHEPEIQRMWPEGYHRPDDRSA